MERIIKITNSWDRRDPDPKKSQGISDCLMIMVLKGELGAVDFQMSTGWWLPELEPTDGSFERLFHLKHPRAYSIGYHSLIPRYEGQDPVGSTRWTGIVKQNIDGMSFDMPVTEKTGSFTPCEYLNGKPCFSDVSYTVATEYLDILIREGSEGVWKRLEEYYEQTFGALR